MYKPTKASREAEEFYMHKPRRQRAKAKKTYDKRFGNRWNRYRPAF